MSKIEKEIRYINEVRASEDSRIVEGYALVFDSNSEDMGFTEIINKDAITDEIIARSDVFCWLNHDEKRGCLGRSKKGKGSLKLSIDDRGLKYEFTAPKTALGDELLESLRRGDITSSSFAFSLPADNSGEKWEKKEDGTHVRTITKFERIYDVSPVYTPAYNDTTINCKRFNDIQSIETNKLLPYWKDLEQIIDTI